MPSRDITEQALRNVDEAGEEGAMFDAERARNEGLHEEVEILFQTRDGSWAPSGMPAPAKFEFAHQLDSSVNLPAEEQTEFEIKVRYRYGYGRKP